MSKRDWIEVGASLLGGAGIGAAIMYFFDPQLGDTRRAECRRASGEALSSAGERLGGAWETVAQKVKGAGESTADTAADWTAKARRFFSGAASSASDYASDAADSARSWGRGVAKSTRRYARRARNAAGDWFDRDEGPSRGTIVGITAGAVAALALGAGLMFLLDPAQGRRRRALIRDKAASAARQTQRYVQQKGRHWSNKVQGLASEAGSLASQAKEKLTGSTGERQGTGTSMTTPSSQPVGAGSPPTF
jgi:gas vesicle protein